MRADQNLLPIVPDSKRELASDRFACWPTAATLTLLMLGIVLPVLEVGDPLTGIALFAVALVLVLTAIAITAFALFKRRMRRAISYATPALIFAVLAIEENYVGAIGLTIDLWRLDHTRARYEAQLPAPDSGGLPRLARFDWRYGGWDAPIELVFDESDEIGLPQGRQSREWLKRANSDSIYRCRFDSEHLEGHFYVVRFAC